VKSSFPFKNKGLTVFLSDAATAFIDDRRAKNLSPATLGFYQSHIDFLEQHQIEKDFPLSVCDINHIQIKSFVSWLLQKKNKKYPDKTISPTTVRKAVITLKTFFKFLHEEEIIESDFYLRIKPPKATKKVISSLSTDEVKRLIKQPDKKHFDGFRDYTMILIFCDCGPRLSEVLNLTLQDVDLEKGTLKVLGKGGKERYIPLGRTAVKTMKKYLLWRGDIEGEKWVFVNLCGLKLDARRFQRRLQNHGEAAGITKVYPHLLRHTFAKNYILQGGDPFSLQLILGHTTLSMVKNYVNLAQQEVSLQHHKYSVIDNLENLNADRKRIYGKKDKRK